MNKSIENLKLIRDLEKIQIIRNLSNEIIEDHYKISSKWIDLKKWVVIPVESALHFNKDDVKNLYKAIKNEVFNECYVIETEFNNKPPKFFCLEICKESLFEINSEFISQGCAIFPNTQAFMILCTIEDYFLVAGSYKFVSEAVGGNLSKSRKKFLKFAKNEFWEKTKSDFLLNIAEKYSE